MQIVDYFYTEQQAADALSVNRLTIWRWMKAKKLSSQHIGSKSRGVVLIPKWEVELMRQVRIVKKQPITK